MSPKASRQLFWQTVLSIVLGVVTGLAILSFSYRTSAEALVNSTLPNLVHRATKRNTIEIFPTLSERMTVLVMGVDSNGRNCERFVGTRSDTMIVVSLDPFTRKVGMVSVPRDSRVKIGTHGMDKINSAHAFGGPELSKQTLAENFGVPIDRYIVVDTQALKELCQLLGPVEVLVEKEMHYDDWAAHLHVHLKPGLQVLNPEQVEQYVRFRHDPRGDIGRIERQQWFFRAAAKKMQDPQFILRLPDLIRMAHDYVRTDLSLEDMARIATFAKDIKPQEVVTATLPGTPEMIAGGSYWVPDLDAGHIVFNRILGLTGGGAFVEEVSAHESRDSAGTTQLAVDTGAPIVKPLSVALKYPKSMEIQANELEKTLTARGYRVRYKWLMPASECQHEQIIQMSARADDDTTAKLRTQVPDLGYWPIVLGLEARPVADFSIVLSPNGTLKTATETMPAVHTAPAAPIQRPVVAN